jgi:AcrR family transcriptional regulator
MKARINPEIVVAATADLADRIGLDQVTLAQVAEQLGIKTPSLYNHVEGMPDLRQKLAAHTANRLADRLGDAAIGQSGKQALIELGKAYLQFARQHPGQYEAINHVVAPQSPEFKHEAQRIMALFIRLMQPLGLPAEEAVHAVRGLRSLVHGFASLESMGGFQLPENPDESLTKAISYYLDGISKQADSRA